MLKLKCDVLQLEFVNHFVHIMYGLNRTVAFLMLDARLHVSNITSALVCFATHKICPILDLLSLCHLVGYLAVQLVMPVNELFAGCQCNCADAPAPHHPK
ncbi:hypothetical protein ILYODFUR_036748 [Ilyodon furcidens]|uniref:Uncharacterized protein n=1 Tax=Ilyodon furcidens TaxID=33524 RepID=A0ABV0UY94_9TELE